MPGIKFSELKERWNNIRKSSRFHDGLVFMAFVAVAALFWFIMALNDNVENTVAVRLNVSNVPDSVTFIQLPPEKIHVAVRDKGTNLMRATLFQHPTVSLNFSDFASDGVLRFSRGDMTAAVRGLFGPGAQVSILSLDSVRVSYTTLKGKRVPVVVSYDVSASSGNIIDGNPVARPSNVLVYAQKDVLDTITRVFTERLVRRSLSETAKVSVALKKVSGARIVPSSVDVVVNVQPLVKKESLVDVNVHGLPESLSLLLFPSKIYVEYFVPMNRFNEDVNNINVWVNFDDTHIEGTKLLPVHLGKAPAGIRNLRLKQDSVEYTLVRN